MSTTTITTCFPPIIVPQAPEDPLFGLARLYKADSCSKKIDLGIGAYRDEDARPWVLPAVKKADEVLRNDPDLNHEYAPIVGLSSFISKAAELVFGTDSSVILENRSASIQTISGTGAVHLGALFLAHFYNRNRMIYLSHPTWANHHQIFRNAGLPCNTYPYFHTSTQELDIDGFKNTLRTAPSGSIFVLHACAHNPTGVDPTREQWKEIAAIMKDKGHFPFFDMAYQGFASGDLDWDAWAVRYFAQQGFELLVAQSFAKNFGLYGERVGCLHAITSSGRDAQATASRIISQLAILQRSEISNPPLYGARIVSAILNDQDLYYQWIRDLQTMSGRIREMRETLQCRLEELQTPGTWKHITNQIGMFSYTGLSKTQVLKLRKDFHVYMTENGRISMAGLNRKNIDYFATAIDTVIRGGI